MFNLKKHWLNMHNSEADFSQIKLVKIADLGTTEAIAVDQVGEIGVAHKLMYNLERKLIKFTLKIILHNIEDKEAGSSVYDFVFEIPNLGEFYSRESNKIVFQSTFISVLAGIAYSTLRGILLQYWQNQHFILPVIEPKQILEAKI